MKPVAIRKSRPVAVKKAGPQLQYDMQGKPSFVFGAGGGGGGGGGRSKRERALGFAGGLVGVAGGALGGHRNLGSLLGSMYAGGAQGSAVAGGLGRKITGRKRQAHLDAREAAKDARARESGQVRVDYRSALRDAKQRASADDDKRWKELQDTEDYDGQYDFKQTKVRGAGMFGGDEAKRRFMREQDPGGKYDTAENQAARAQREKVEQIGAEQPEAGARAVQRFLASAEARWRAGAMTDEEYQGYMDKVNASYANPDANVNTQQNPFEGVNQQRLNQMSEMMGRDDATRTAAQPGTGGAMMINGGGAFAQPLPEQGIEGNVLASEQVAPENSDANRTQTLSGAEPLQLPAPLTAEQQQTARKEGQMSLQDFMNQKPEESDGG